MLRMHLLIIVQKQSIIFLNLCFVYCRKFRSHSALFERLLNIVNFTTEQLLATILALHC